MLKAYIVDDEPLARDELVYILRRSKKVDVVGEAGQAEQALAQIEELEPEVVFLDIQLANDSGLDLAAKLAELDARPEIVFATAYDEYALQAFEHSAFDYILKPFDEMRIRKTIDKLADRMKLRNAVPPLMQERCGKLAVYENDRILLIDINSILYISSSEGKTEIVTEDRKYVCNEPLVTIEQKMRGTAIARVHRAYLVNVDGIVEIQPWFHSTYTLVMNNGDKVPVSRTFMKDLKQRIRI